MIKQSLLAAAAAASVFSAAMPVTAEARDRRGVYDDRGRYYEPRRVSRDQVWRGNDGRYYCKRSNGTTGLLIGGAAGALIGREIAGRNGDRTLGAILGAAGGALLGREVSRSTSQCR